MLAYTALPFKRMAVSRERGCIIEINIRPDQDVFIIHTRTGAGWLTSCMQKLNWLKLKATFIFCGKMKNVDGKIIKASYENMNGEPVLFSSISVDSRVSSPWLDTILPPALFDPFYMSPCHHMQMQTYKCDAKNMWKTWVFLCDFFSIEMFIPARHTIGQPVFNANTHICQVSRDYFA